MVGQVLSQSCIGSTTIDYDDNQETVYVWTYGHLAKLYEVIHWTTGRPGLGIKFRARVGAPCGPAWRSLTRKMATHAPCVGFNFVGCDPPTMTWDAQELSGRWGPAKFPLALFPHLPHIETIEFEKRFYPCPVLRFLATPRDRGRGMSWLCPGLDTILVWPDVYDDSDSDSDDRDDDRNHDKEYRIISKGVLDFIIQRYPMEMFEEEESYLGDCDGSGTSDDGGVEDEEDGNTATGDKDDSGDHGGVTSDGDDCSVSESLQISSTGSSCAYWHDMLVKLSLPSRVVQRLKKIDDVVLYEFIRDGVITTS
ncbi:hypothetical protein FRB99_001079 [Tulasnella sp. 403]|nr:hypothetical protein FRB99_001079 [Tulasnella sp. 403]